MQWTLVIPLKPLALAKSRLADTATDGLRPGLALAFAEDTVAAALASPAVRDVAVVTDDALAGRVLAALGARIVADEPRGGLNAALAHGAAAVRAFRPDSPLAALNADLPALRPSELARVLDAAGEFPALFSRTPPGSAPRFSPSQPAVNCFPHSARIPVPGTAPPGPWNSARRGWIPFARTWTPARICARRCPWVWVPGRPRRRRIC